MIGQYEVRLRDGDAFPVDADNLEQALQRALQHVALHEIDEIECIANLRPDPEDGDYEAGV